MSLAFRAPRIRALPKPPSFGLDRKPRIRDWNEGRLARGRGGLHEAGDARSTTFTEAPILFLTGADEASLAARLEARNKTDFVLLLSSNARVQARRRVSADVA